MLRVAMILGLLVQGCTQQRVYTSVDPQGALHVSGPMEGVGPFKTADEAEEALCPIIMKMPGAQDGERGIEYCGLVYHTPTGWHPTQLAFLPYQRPGGVRSCQLPVAIDDAQTPAALIVTILDFHSHPWPNTRFTEAYTVQGRLRGDLMPTPGHPLKLVVNGEVLDYRRVMFSTKCDHYRYYPARQEILKHDHHDQHWEKIADVEVLVDEQTGEILRSRVKMLPGKDW